MSEPGDWPRRNAAEIPGLPALVHRGETLKWGDLASLAALEPFGAALAERAHFAGMAARPVPPDVRLVAMTSGSSGAPKGVMLTGAAIAAAVRASRARLGLEREDAWLCCLPLEHVGGLSILYRCAEAGACVLLHDRFDPAAVWDDVSAGRASHISLVPAMLARLLEMAEAAPPSRLRQVLVGGAALDGALARRALDAGWPLAVTYGMTETASQLATLAEVPADWRPGLVGRPLDGFEVTVADDGRIRVRGPAVMAGYLGGGGLDAEGWFTTGDRGRRDAAGNLWVLGRADEALTSGGATFQPEEVEALLAACPGVTEAAVAGRPDPVWGDLVVALVAGMATEDDVLAWCRDNIEGAHRPRVVVKVDALPRTALGKPDRAALRRTAAG